MKNTMMTTLLGLLALGMTQTPVQAQSKGQTVIYVGQEVRQGIGEWRRTNTDRKAVEAQRQVALEQTAAWERIAHHQIDAQVENETNRTAAEVYRTAAETGTSGSATVRNGQVTANVVKIDPAGRNGRGPLIRVE